MDKKKLQKDVGYKLRKIREASKNRPFEMADSLGTWQSTYSRYEKGETALNIVSLYKLASKFNVSLDWLIQSKGSMYLNENDQKQKIGPKSTEQKLLSSLDEDVKELLEFMSQNKLLRYEILAHFQKFKEKNNPPAKTPTQTD